MTRKDYVAIAEAIREEWAAWEEAGPNSDTGKWACADVAVKLCEVFAADNPRFDEERFLEAATGHANPSEAQATA